MNILETKAVAERFSGLIAVNQIFTHVEEGKIIGLIGPNGGGKTTLLNAIAGLNPHTSESVFFFGKETTGLVPEERRRNHEKVGDKGSCCLRGRNTF